MLVLGGGVVAGQVTVGTTGEGRNERWSPGAPRMAAQQELTYEMECLRPGGTEMTEGHDKGPLPHSQPAGLARDGLWGAARSVMS